MNKVWNHEDRQFIMSNANDMTDEQLAKYFTNRLNRNVTLHAVRKQRQKLGLTKKPGRGVCELLKNEFTETEETVPLAVS